MNLTFTFSLGNVTICAKPVIPFLGVNLDKNLNFAAHIKLVSNKMSESIGVTYRLQDFLPSATLRQLYCSSILPYLTYGVAVWAYAPARHLNG